MCDFLGIDSSSTACIVASMCHLVCGAVKKGDQQVLEDARRIVNDRYCNLICHVHISIVALTPFELAGIHLALALSIAHFLLLLFQREALCKAFH